MSCETITYDIRNSIVTEFTILIQKYPNVPYILALLQTKTKSVLGRFSHATLRTNQPRTRSRRKPPK